jgi:hypothetical protein
MATTRLIPLHTGKGRTIAQALGRSTDYIENPDKTDDGEWITAYACDPLIADAEFRMSKRQYAVLTGRDQGDRDVIAYHMRQSFEPGEIDPATANKIGYELVMKLTKGNHAFLVCTHVDKAHIHSHIIFNSTSLDCSRKFRNFWNSSFAIRRISDLLCAAQGLSIVEHPKPSRGSYGTWLGDKKPPSQRDTLRELMDASFREGDSLEAFLTALKSAGCAVKRGKHLSIKPPGGKQFLRCKSLGADYTEEAIRERLSGLRVVTSKTKIVAIGSAPAKPNLLIDIQAKIQQGKGPGYERWAKLFNLKEMAKTLVFLQERGLADYDTLAEKAQAAAGDFDQTAARLKAIESRLSEISALQKHIGAYSKTREVYSRYRDSKWSKKFYAEHEADILLHRAAKKYFDSLGLTKLPAMQTLKTEYATLAAEKKKLYSDYRAKKEKMIALLMAKQNVDRLLGASSEQEQKREADRDSR